MFLVLDKGGEPNLPVDMVCDKIHKYRLKRKLPE